MAGAFLPPTIRDEWVSCSNYMNDFSVINGIYAEYFTGDAPARSCVEVSKLPKGGLIEIEAIAVKSK